MEKRLERLRRFGHVQRTDSGHTGQRMLKIEPLGRRKIGRLQRKSMNLVKDGVHRVRVTEKDASVRMT